MEDRKNGRQENNFTRASSLLHRFPQAAVVSQIPKSDTDESLRVFSCFPIFLSDAAANRKMENRKMEDRKIASLGLLLSYTAFRRQPWSVKSRNRTAMRR